MTILAKTILAAIGVLILLTVIVGGTLRHYIGGFIANIERESEEERQEDEHRAAKPVSDEKTQE